jgi:hypothetical protein
MAWRAQLSDRPIRALAILSTKPGILAAWTQSDRSIFLDLSSGAKVSDLTLIPPANPPPAPLLPPPLLIPVTPPAVDEQSDHSTMDFDLSPPMSIGMKWVAQMKAPNGDFLPMIRVQGTAVYPALDGSFWARGTEQLGWFFETETESRRLEIDAGARIVSFAFDRKEGVSAALDSRGRLHLHRRAVRIGTFDTPLQIKDDLQPAAAIPEDGSWCFLTDGTRIAIFDLIGNLQKTIELHFSLGAFCVSPDGKTIVVGDLDAGVLRVYGGRNWLPVHQRFAVDVLAEAKRAQLMGTGTTSGAALGPIAIGAKGALAFAIAGTVCVTTVARLKPPAPPKIKAPPSLLTPELNSGAVTAKSSGDGAATAP